MLWRLGVIVLLVLVITGVAIWAVREDRPRRGHQPTPLSGAHDGRRR